MHRAGTSLIARVVNLLGVYLGPEEHLMKPQKDNPSGYWENQLLTDLNEEILSRFGGTWDKPPIFPERWEKSPKIADLRRRARRIVREDFRDAPLWGWKDPRTCITLPFWQRLFPRMRYVICLRNPVDVAKSIERRNGFPLEKRADLWLCYMKSALEHTAGQPRLLVSYEDFMTSWEEELPSLSKFLGRARQAEKPNVKRAVHRFVRQDLQHHRTSIASVVREHRIPFPAKALFTVLKAYASIKEAHGLGQSRRYHEIQDTLDGFSQHSTAAQDDAERLKAENAGLAQDIAGISNELARTRADAAETSNELARTRADAAETSNELARTCAELAAIKGSYGYRFMRLYGSIIDRLFSKNNRRQRP